MIRCPRCGLRLSDAQPSCPTHGLAPVEAEPLSALPVPAAAVGAPADRYASDAVEAQTPDAFIALGYRITRVLGRGGFGVVYGAERVRDGLTVAIKMTLPEQPQADAQLLRETALLALVGPPHVPIVYEHGTVLGRRYAVIEYIAAPTLADKLESLAGPVPLEHFDSIAQAILRSLSAIHAHDIAHRDLKPENLFVLERDGGTEVKIIDFGLANDVQTRGQGEGVSDDDAIGTAEYMSPEQCDGRVDADKRSDIYSVGVLLYELLTGAPPFWGKSADVREAHRSRRPAPVLQKIDCPPLLDQVIRRCLSKDRASRYDDVAMLSRALHVALSEGHTPADRPGPVTLVGAEAKAPAPAAPAAREKRSMGLVFFESAAGLSAVQLLIASSGGQIVQTNGSQYVAAFGHDVGDNPVRIAFAAAQRLSIGKLAARSLVDVATVSVQARADGTKRVFSPVFAKKDRFPSGNDPAGVMFSSAATEVVPDLRIAALPDRPDRFLAVVSQQSNDATTYGIQSSTLIGRDEPIGLLRESARQALIMSAPSLVTVVAEPGYGKTHFARALEQQLERLVPTVDVIRLTAQEAMVGAGSQLVPDLLRRLLTLPDHVAAESARSVLLDRLGAAGEQVWAGAAFALGWLDDDHPDVRRLAAAPGALRLAAARAAGEALRKRARLTPVAVVLDDAHLADDALLDALEYATLREAGARLWVCTLARPAFEQRRTGWGTRAARQERHVLPALSPSSAGELARRLLHPVEFVPPSALVKLAERTQGVPRLLVELIRGLKRDGLVRRAERGNSYYLATDELDKLPDLPIVQWNTVREVEAMPPQLAGHARLSSVLGGGFTVPDLDNLLQVLERSGSVDDMQLDASVGVQRLVDAGMLVRHRNGRLDFRHALLRDTIYQLVPEGQRKLLHRAALEMYQAAKLPEDQRLPRLALHAAQSGEREVAARAYLELAERSQKAHLYLDAEAAFGSALDNLASDDAEKLVIAARGRGLMRFRLGRHEDSLRDLRSARERAQALGKPAIAQDLALDEATVLDWLRDFAQSAALVRQVAALQLEGAQSELLSLKLTTCLARIHHRQAEHEACIKLAAEAIEKTQVLDDESYEPRMMALLMIATDCANTRRFEEAERYFEAAIAESTAHADMHHLGAAHINRAFLGLAKQDVESCFLDLTRATEISRQTGEPTLEYVAQANIAEVAYAMEDLVRASETSERTAVLARQLWGETNRELSGCELMLARIQLLRGNLSEARALIDRISARLQEAEAAGSIEMRLLPSEQALFDMVELGSRAASAAEWSAFAERYPHIEMQLVDKVEILEGHALAALRAGRTAESREVFVRALELSREQPNLVGERVVRRFATTFGSAAQQA